MSQVTIEGSISPSTFLARGERATVQRTEKIDTLIKRGFVVIVSEQASDVPEPEGLTELEQHADADAQAARDALGVPARNASRAAWAEFLSGLTPPADFGDEDGRDDLVEIWDTYDPEA